LHLIGKALLLRRTKEEIDATAEDANKIPAKHIEDVHVALSDAEEAVYTDLFDYAKSIMRSFLDQQKDRLEMQNAANNYVAGAMKKSRSNKTRTESTEEADHRFSTIRFSTILVLITRLRQLAVLPYLIKTMLEDDDKRDDGDDVAYDALSDPINSKNPIFKKNYKSTKIKAVS